MKSVARCRGLALCCIPKNANTAMKAALLEAMGIEPPEDEHALHRHPALRLCKPALVRGMFTAGFLRHPADRLASCWRDKIYHDRGLATRNLERLGFRAGMPFEDFVRRALDVRDGDVHLRPQVKFLAPRMDFIGRVERLPGDWDRLRRLFPWLPRLRHLNGTSRPGGQDRWPRSLLAVIERGYAEDMELWLKS